MPEIDVYRILEQLRGERDRLDHVIRAVEALSSGKRRRGRPPKFMTAANKPASTRRSRSNK